MDDAGVLSGLPHAVLVVSPDGRTTYANAAARRLTGRQDLLGHDPVELVVPEHRPRARTLLGGRPGAPARLRLAGEDERWVAVCSAGGPEGGTVLSLSEVTGQVLDRRRLRRSEQRFRAAFEAAAHGTALVGERGGILAVNASLAALLGRTASDLVGTHVARLLADPAAGPADWARHGTVARRLLHAGGGAVHVLVTTTAVEGDAGESLSLVQVQDVTERRRSEQRLRHLALHDQLTDLPSRSLLLQRLGAALVQRNLAAPVVAVLFVDLDEFKLVNDALGHAAGDAVLRQVALRLRSVTRPPDTVARLSGDEFVVLCPALGSQAEALAIADRLSASLRLPVRSPDDEIVVSASIGVASTDSGATTAHELLRDADAAMYRAKQLGRRRYQVFDTSLRERAGERNRVRGLLTRALAEDRVVVHYQPLVDVAGRTVVALEALLRLRDDDGTLLLPDTFLGAALESGALRQLDEQVLALAAPAVAGWSTAYGLPLGLAVNLCAARLDAELAPRVLAALAVAGLPPAQLLVEVTEQTLAGVGAGPPPGDLLRALQRSGVRVALDDFGTGSGSLTCLRSLPVSMLKVDRSLVAQLPADADGLVRVMVSLAGQLGLDATAEGVETEEQLAALRVLAPAYAQGFLFGGPVPASEVPALLERLGVRDSGGWRPRPAPPAHAPSASS